MYAAYKHFFEEMNFFFASIAAETLRMLGVDDVQVDVLKSFKLKSKGDVVYEKDFIDGFCFRGTSCIASNTEGLKIDSASSDNVVHVSEIKVGG